MLSRAGRDHHFQQDMEVSELKVGENFVKVKVTLGKFVKNLVSVYLPPDKVRAVATIEALEEASAGWENVVIMGDFNCTETDSLKDVNGHPRKELFTRC